MLNRKHSSKNSAASQLEICIVDEARTRDSHLAQHIRFWQCCNQQLRNLARRFAQRLCQVARIIAMRCQLGTFNKNLGLGEIRRNLAQRLRKQLGQMGFEI